MTTKAAHSKASVEIAKAAGFGVTPLSPINSYGRLIHQVSCCTGRVAAGWCGQCETQEKSRVLLCTRERRGASARQDTGLVTILTKQRSLSASPSSCCVLDAVVLCYSA
jgi:hypothetical protein